MIEDVKRCVAAKQNFLAEYFTVPAAVQGSVDALVADMNALGEGCRSATEFEERFVSTGLSERFNALLPQCTPKTMKMTREQRQNSRKVMREMVAENKKELLRDAATDITRDVAMAVDQKCCEERRAEMIREGTYADYTRHVNRVEDAGIVLRFLRNRFGKR